MLLLYNNSPTHGLYRPLFHVHNFPNNFVLFYPMRLA